MLGVKVDIGRRIFFKEKMHGKNQIKFHNLFKISINVIVYEFSETRSKMYTGLHVKYPLFLTDIEET